MSATIEDRSSGDIVELGASAICGEGKESSP